MYPWIESDNGFLQALTQDFTWVYLKEEDCVPYGRDAILQEFSTYSGEKHETYQQ